MSLKDVVMRTEARPRCCVCGGSGSVVYSDIPDRLFAAPGKWTIVRCENPACRLLWLDPMPAAEDLHKAYGEYYTHGDAEAWPDSPLRSAYARWVKNPYLAAKFGYRALEAGVLGRILRGALYFLHPVRRHELDASVMYLPARDGGRLLEIGFGSGALLKRMRGLGWRAEGCDFDPVCVERARAEGFEARLAPLKGAGYPDDHFDAVVMSHAFEHVPDPLELLGEIRRILKPGGLFISLTPNAAAYGHRKFKEHWLALDPPRHLHLFTPASLRLEMAKVPFSKVNIFTTINGAAYIHLASRDVAKTGRHRFGGPLNQAEWKRGRRFQLLEWFLLWFQPDAGEELVVIASK
jgi:SAM-dependent methyltransferase